MTTFPKWDSPFKPPGYLAGSQCSLCRGVTPSHPPEQDIFSSWSGRSAVDVLACSPRMSGSAFRRPARPVDANSCSASSISPISDGPTATANSTDTIPSHPSQTVRPPLPTAQTQSHLTHLRRSDRHCQQHRHNPISPLSDGPTATANSTDTIPSHPSQTVRPPLPTAQTQSHLTHLRRSDRHCQQRRHNSISPISDGPTATANSTDTIPSHPSQTVRPPLPTAQTQSHLTHLRRSDRHCQQHTRNPISPISDGPTATANSTDTIPSHPSQTVRPPLPTAQTQSHLTHLRRSDRHCQQHRHNPISPISDGPTATANSTDTIPSHPSQTVQPPLPTAQTQSHLTHLRRSDRHCHSTDTIPSHPSQTVRPPLPTAHTQSHLTHLRRSDRHCQQHRHNPISDGRPPLLTAQTQSHLTHLRQSNRHCQQHRHNPISDGPTATANSTDTIHLTHLRRSNRHCQQHRHNPISLISDGPTATANSTDTIPSHPSQTVRPPLPTAQTQSHLTHLRRSDRHCQQHRHNPISPISDGPTATANSTDTIPSQTVRPPLPTAQAQSNLTHLRRSDRHCQQHTRTPISPISDGPTATANSTDTIPSHSSQTVQPPLPTAQTQSHLTHLRRSDRHCQQHRHNPISPISDGPTATANSTDTIPSQTVRPPLPTAQAQSNLTHLRRSDRHCQQHTRTPISPISDGPTATANSTDTIPSHSSQTVQPPLPTAQTQSHLRRSDRHCQQHRHTHKPHLTQSDCCRFANQPAYLDKRFRPHSGCAQPNRPQNQLLRGGLAMTPPTGGVPDAERINSRQEATCGSSRSQGPRSLSSVPKFVDLGEK